MAAGTASRYKTGLRLDTHAIYIPCTWHIHIYVHVQCWDAISNSANPYFVPNPALMLSRTVTGQKSWLSRTS